VFREGIAAVLSLEPDIEMVAEAQNAAEAVALFRQHRPDVVLMDIKPPMGAEWTRRRRFAGNFPGRESSCSRRTRGCAGTQGAESGCVGFSAQEHCTARTGREHSDGASGQQRILEEVALELAMHAADDLLSAREMEVLQSVAQGQSNKGLPGRWVSPEETVKTIWRACWRN